MLLRKGVGSRGLHFAETFCRVISLYPTPGALRNAPFLSTLPLSPFRPCPSSPHTRMHPPPAPPGGGAPPPVGSGGGGGTLACGRGGGVPIRTRGQTLRYSRHQCSESGSRCLWAIRIRIHLSEVWIRIRILLLSCTIVKKYLDSYCFVTPFGL